MKRRRGSHPKSFGFINWVDNVNWPPLTDSKADVSSVSPTSERIEGLWMVPGIVENNRRMQAFVDTVRTKSADLKNKF